MTDHICYSAVNDRGQAVTIVRRGEQGAFTFHLLVDGRQQYQEAFALEEAQTLFFNHVIAS